MKKVLLFVAGSALLALAAPVVAQAHTLQLRSITYQGMCLDDTGWSKTPGTHLQLWSCLYPYSSHMNQSWEFDYLGDTWCLGETYVRCNVYLVRNAYATGMCLDDWMNSSGQSPAVIYTCNRYDPAQQIEVENLGSLVDNTPFNELSHYRFSNCLDNSNDRIANGNPIQFYPCNSSDAQSWIGNQTS